MASDALATLDVVVVVAAFAPATREFRLLVTAAGPTVGLAILAIVGDLAVAGPAGTVGFFVGAAVVFDSGFFSPVCFSSIRISHRR